MDNFTVGWLNKPFSSDGITKRFPIVPQSIVAVQNAARRFGARQGEGSRLHAWSNLEAAFSSPKTCSYGGHKGPKIDTH